MAYRIRELREKKKLTQEQLSQMSGVSRTTIVQLENNEEHEAMKYRNTSSRPAIFTIPAHFWHPKHGGIPSASLIRS